MDKNATNKKNISYKRTTIGTRASSIACPTDCGFLVGNKLERERLSKKRWRDNNKEKIHLAYIRDKKKRKEYFIKNKDRINAIRRDKRKNNRDEFIKKQHLYDELHPTKKEYRYFQTKRTNSGFELSFDDYKLLIKKQLEVCAICGKKDKKRALTIDHNHKTKKVRGLLCKKCNTAIGMLNDNPVLVLSAYNYLQNG